MKRSAYIVGLLLIVGIALPMVAHAGIDDVYYWANRPVKENARKQKTPQREIKVDSLSQEQREVVQPIRKQQPQTEFVLEQDTVVKLVIHR
ncbi:MAG: hypothetical protein MJZ92_00230 [Paludibacteraceae bacterium]|nr:hypothetical protein [Paludibacteraceae bacterium]